MSRRKLSDKGLVAFFVDSTLCAVEVPRVEEVVRPGDIAPLATPIKGVIGLADYRGRVVPVVDVAMVMSGACWRAERECRWIVARGAGRGVALAVDSVRGVFLSTQTENVGDYPLAQGRDIISGVVRHEGELVYLLDLDRLMKRKLNALVASTNFAADEEHPLQ